MIAFLLSGILLGLSGGLAPGPLLTLVASETLRHGARAGIRVALAPLLTDLPIILATVLLLRPLTDQATPLALLHLSGGLYLAWLGLQGVRFRGAELESTAPTDSLWRGVIANFLNPSPYLFWLAVGTPTVLAAWREGWPAAVAFVVAFYGLLVGSKVLLAVVLGRARHLLRSGGYIVLMRSLGLLLLIYALLFLRAGGRIWLA
ncbi:MAG: LysE family transporter [Candidatus Contendobacter sp.]|nr:LysE family transporter [Candidatus Contendobacter sp.]MDS4057527.1 LysE family transporter [Candidatus Contendobacter sp.]